MLRDQILARIDATPFRPPTFRDINNICISHYESEVRAELDAMLAAREIDTQNGDSGLTYKRAKAHVQAPAPSPHAPVPIPQKAHDGLAFFPSKNPNAQPTWHGYNTPGERETIRACRAPRPQTKTELAAQAKADRAAKFAKLRAKESAEKVAKKAARKKSIPPDRTNYANRALVSQYLTYPMSAAQFGELVGFDEVEARSMLFNMAHRGFIKYDVRTQPKLYFFERPAEDKIAEFRAFAQKFKVRRGLDMEAIAADYLAGSKMKAMGKKYKVAELAIAAILDDLGVKRRARGELIKGVPRGESLRAENEALRARIHTSEPMSVQFIFDESARVKASNLRLEQEAIQREGDADRARLKAKDENERLRARVAELEAKLIELHGDFYRSAAI